MTTQALSDKGVPFPRLFAAVGQDEDALRDIIRTFVVEGAELDLDLRRAAFEHDLPIVARICHSVRGNARDFEDGTLAQLAQALEALARQGAAAEVQRQLPDVEAALQRLVLRLREFLGDEA